jgi:hypothetical protein
MVFKILVTAVCCLLPADYRLLAADCRLLTVVFSLF